MEPTKFIEIYLSRQLAFGFLWDKHCFDIFLPFLSIGFNFGGEKGFHFDNGFKNKP